MLSRFVEEGSKVELRALEHGLGESGAENTTKVYQSRVLQIYRRIHWRFPCQWNRPD